MPLAVNEEEIRQLLKTEAFIKMYNFQLHSINEEESAILIPFDQSLTRPGGVISGPVYMAAADLAAWIAVIAQIGMPEGRMTVTAEMKTSFMSVCKEDFLCKARLLKVGKRLIYIEAECVTFGGKLLTHHTLTYIRPDKITDQ